MGNKKKIDLMFYDNISIGHSKSYSPPKRYSSKFSDYVDQANMNGDIVINVGNGYYRPLPTDPIDNFEFNSYISSELDKANIIIEKCRRMSETYNKVSSKLFRKENE